MHNVLKTGQKKERESCGLLLSCNERRDEQENNNHTEHLLLRR